MKWRPRLLGFTVLAWLALPLLWWQSGRAVPRETVFEKVTGGNCNCTFSSDGQLFVANAGEQIRVYDVPGQRLLGTWPLRFDAIFTSFRLCDGRALAGVCHRGGDIDIVDLMNGEKVSTLDSTSKIAIPLMIQLAPRANVAATVHNNHIVRLSDLATGKLKREFTLHNARVRWIRLADDGCKLAVCDSGTVKMIDFTNNTITTMPSPLNVRMLNVAFMPDGRVIGVSHITPDETALCDLTTDRILVRRPMTSGGIPEGCTYYRSNHYPFRPLSSLAFRVGATTQGTKLLDLESDWRIYDASDGKLLATTPQFPSMAIFPNGRTMATYSLQNDCVQLWDLPPRTVVHRAFAWVALMLSIALSVIWWRRRESVACASG